METIQDYALISTMRAAVGYFDASQKPEDLGTDAYSRAARLWYATIRIVIDDYSRGGEAPDCALWRQLLDEEDPLKEDGLVHAIIQMMIAAKQANQERDFGDQESGALWAAIGQGRPPWLKPQA